MKVYVGFSVDMDRAYCNCNIHGNFIPKSSPDYIKIQNHRLNFIKYTNKLLDYFKNTGYEKSVTWFVNEADYTISSNYSEILKKCASTGELGLHTHLNSQRFNALPHTMSSNREDWEQEGIINANNNINKFIKYNNYIYKAGNHIRSDVLYDTLADNLFSIDTTVDINGRNFDDGHLFYDDTKIPLGTEPFFIKCKNNGILLEIPEIRINKVLEHIKSCEHQNNLCFIKLQIHHWQYDEFIPQFDEMFATIKKLGYDMEFIDLRQMQNLFFEKKMMILERQIKSNIKRLMQNDKYYTSLNQTLSGEFLELATWLFNNCDKRSKIVELFAGIGQCSIFLHELGFSNITISDFDSNRCNFYNSIGTYEHITPYVCDFFNINLDSYDICFFGNSINSSLCTNLDKQVEKYQRFIDNGKLLIIHAKYGSGIKEFNYLLDHLQYYKIVKQLGEYFILNKHTESIQIIPFSPQFKQYKKIALDGIYDEIICENGQYVLKLSFKDNVKPSAGIFFPINSIYPDLQEKCYKTILRFDVKIDKVNIESKLKIYTGEKWVILDNQLSEDYQTIEFKDDFNFYKVSTYRIGFVNMEKNSIYFKNISINI